MYSVYRNNQNEYLETALRSRWQHKTTDKLTTQFLVIHQDMQDTKQGIDPFIFDNNGEFIINQVIEEGKDPSLTTMSLGGEYDWSQWISTYGIWEYTNDFQIATSGYPRFLLNDSSITTVLDNGNISRYPRASPWHSTI